MNGSVSKLRTREHSLCGVDRMEQLVGRFPQTVEFVPGEQCHPLVAMSDLSRRKACLHQVSVLSGIPRRCPNSRRVNPLRCQRVNTRAHLPRPW